MRILFVTEFFPTGKDLKFSGGVEARTYFLAKYLAKKHKITVIASKIKSAPATEKMFGFTIYRVGPRRTYVASVGDIIARIKFILEAIKFAKRLDADIIDGGNYIAHFIARQIAKSKKVPVVAWYPDVWIGNWLKNSGIYGLLGELLERLNLLLGFDSYIAISKETAKKLKKYTKEKINVIYCGVDRKEFEKKVPKFPDLTIICVSRLASYKNIKTLIFAFAYLNTKVKNAQLVVVGTGPEEKKLREQVVQLKISSKVKFRSNLSRKSLINLYKSSHIFSLPSLVEGFGIATIEAAAAGLPYVNSDIPIQREVTKNGKGGFLVDPYSPISFSKNLYSLLNDKTLYKQKVREGHSLIRAYNWENISQQTEKVYKSLIPKTKLRHSGFLV